MLAFTLYLLKKINKTASWTYDGNGINLLKNSDTGDISNYITNGEWTLESLLVERNIKIYSCCPVP